MRTATESKPWSVGGEHVISWHYSYVRKTHHDITVEYDAAMGTHYDITIILLFVYNMTSQCIMMVLCVSCIMYYYTQKSEIRNQKSEIRNQKSENVLFNP